VPFHQPPVPPAQPAAEPNKLDPAAVLGQVTLYAERLVSAIEALDGIGGGRTAGPSPRGVWAGQAGSDPWRLGRVARASDVESYCPGPSTRFSPRFVHSTA
jgi:hypothetical protein